MQEKGKNEVTSAKEVAENFNLSPSLVAKVLQQLAKSKLVQPIQGPSGGYILNRSLNSIKLNDFIEIIEGPVGIVECLKDPDCVHVENCNIRVPIERVNNTIINIFSNITLADITK
jgi:Rrf2 family protein